MDRIILLDHIELAERHVRQSAELMSRQQTLVAELERYDHDVAEARELLAQLSEIHALCVAHRERLVTALAENSER